MFTSIGTEGEITDTQPVALRVYVFYLCPTVNAFIRSRSMIPASLVMLISRMDTVESRPPMSKPCVHQHRQIWRAILEDESLTFPEIQLLGLTLHSCTKKL